MRQRYRPTTWRAAWWAARAARQAAAIATDGLDRGEISPPPPLPDPARAGVAAALKLMRQKCLVQALVLQRWDAAHGTARDVIIGVRPDDDRKVKAHAWLDGDRDGYGFVELSRRPPPQA